MQEKRVPILLKKDIHMCIISVSLFYFEIQEKRKKSVMTKKVLTFFQNNCLLKLNIFWCKRICIQFWRPWSPQWANIVNYIDM